MVDRILRFFKSGAKMDRRESLDFTAWACENAIRFSPFDIFNADIEMLSPLDEILAVKRVVFLGEEDHWVHEKNDFRILLLRYLISRGWRHVGEELGRSDGLRVDRYLETGDSSHLSGIATYGCRDALRTDRDDRPSGILKESYDRYPVKEFASEQTRLAEALLHLNQTREAGTDRIHFFGFDIDALAGGGYRDLEELLGSEESDNDISNIRERLKPVPGETVREEISRLKSAATMIADRRRPLMQSLGEERYLNLLHWTETLRDSFEFIFTANPASDMKTLNRAMAFRERVMSRHVSQALEKMKPDDRLVLMGHNRHLSKDMHLIRNKGGAVPGGRRTNSLGAFVNEWTGGSVFSIWMLHDCGLSSQPFSSLGSKYTTVPGSLNAALAEVGEAFLLLTASDDRRADVLKRPVEIAGIYNIPYRTAIAKQADAIFFKREVSPLRS
jgi:erythromycin esterase-like protein